MEVTIYDKPCLVLETIELVYSWMNRIPAEELTDSDPICIPRPEMEQIRQEVCKDLDPEDEELKFYFRGVPLELHEGEHKRLSCLAIAMVGSLMPLGCYEVEEAEEELHRLWTRYSLPFSVGGFGVHIVSIHETDKFTTLAKEFGKYPLPADYRAELVEVFTAYDYHVARLTQLLKPLAERLKPLLEPWIAAERVLQWREFLSTEEGIGWFLDVCNLKICPDKVELTLRYISPDCRPGLYRGNDDGTATIFMHWGVAGAPGVYKRASKTAMSNNDYTVFRLLSSPDCMAVLRTVAKTEKSIQELSQEMDMNPGSVFRHVNNLYNAGLLSLKVIHNRNYYTANLPRLKKLTDHLLAHLGWSE